MSQNNETQQIKDLSFSDLKALLEMVNAQVVHVSESPYFGPTHLAKWQHHQAVVQQIINRKVAAYFSEEPIN